MPPTIQVVIRAPLRPWLLKRASTPSTTASSSSSDAADDADDGEDVGQLVGTLGGAARIRVTKRVPRLAEGAERDDQTDHLECHEQEEQVTGNRHNGRPLTGRRALGIDHDSPSPKIAPTPYRQPASSACRDEPGAPARSGSANLRRGVDRQVGGAEQGTAGHPPAFFAVRLEGEPRGATGLVVVVAHGAGRRQVGLSGGGVTRLPGLGPGVAPPAEFDGRCARGDGAPGSAVQSTSSSSGPFSTESRWRVPESSSSRCCTQLQSPSTRRIVPLTAYSRSRIRTRSPGARRSGPPRGDSAGWPSARLVARRRARTTITATASTATAATRHVTSASTRPPPQVRRRRR